MLAVSNVSPLMHLSMIGRIDLLRRFSSVCIPPAVRHEVVEQRGSYQVFLILYFRPCSPEGQMATQTSIGNCDK